MAVSEKTRKILWAGSGKRCAYCQMTLIEPAKGLDDPSVVGDECHIISKKGEGPRFDPLFQGDHDDCENLILLCRRDHKMVDDQVTTFTAERLKSLKALHEAKVERALAVVFENNDQPPVSQGFDNFRTTIVFMPDEDDSLLESFQERLIHDVRLHAYGKIGTGFKSNATGRYAAWIQAFLPVSGELLKRLAADTGVALVSISHERLPGVYKPSV
jgi:hypothetical protein